MQYGQPRVLTKEMIGLRVRLTFGLWVNYRKNLAGPVPPPFKELFERWKKGELGIGVITNLRPKMNYWGRHPYEFLVDFTSESWWLPRGCFELISHGKVAGLNPVEEAMYKVSAPQTPHIAQEEKQEVQVQQGKPPVYTKIRVDPTLEEIDRALAIAQEKLRGEPSPEDKELIAKGILR